MTTHLSIAYLHAYARYAREVAEAADKLNKVLGALRECESNRTYLHDKELLFAKGEEYVAIFERRALDQASVA